jgi:hypothetical protein
MNLTITLTTKRSLDSEQVFRGRKAVEHLYYFAAITGTPNYANDEAIWIAWSKMGFDTSLVEGPRGLPRAEGIRVQTQPEPRYTEYRAQASNAGALKTVATIVNRLEATKASFQGKDDAARLGVFLEDRELNQALLNPVVAALSRQKTLRADESKRLVKAAQDCLVWLTDNDVTSLSAADAVPA